MTIAAGDIIFKFGTQDEVTSGTPAIIADDAYGKADQGASVNWANTDNTPNGSAVLKAQFDTTMPTVGSIELYARLLNVQGANDIGIPDANNPLVWVGTFNIDFGIAADTDFYMSIHDFEMPQAGDAQAIDWYLHNNGSAQTLGVSWQLWITPKTYGAAA